MKDTRIMVITTLRTVLKRCQNRANLGKDQQQIESILLLLQAMLYPLPD